MLGRPVCNYGIPGEMAKQGLPRLSRLMTSADSSVVVVMEGVNDLGAYRTSSAILRDLTRMLQVVRRRHLFPVLTTLVPTYYPSGHPQHGLNRQVRALSSQILRLAHKQHGTLADVERVFLKDRRGVNLTRHSGVPDYLHPNDAGYRMIAVTVAKAIKSHLKSGKRSKRE